MMVYYIAVGDCYAIGVVPYDRGWRPMFDYACNECEWLVPGTAS